MSNIFIWNKGDEMSENIAENQMQQILNFIYDKAVNGMLGLKFRKFTYEVTNH